jgi:hypothetical protein
MVMRLIDFSSGSRLEELILYVAKQSVDDPDFGAVKMQKILFWADFMHYAKHGQSISGGRYCKQDQGPVLRSYKPAERSLLQRGDAEIQERERGPRTQKRLIAKRDANPMMLSAEHTRIADAAIAALVGMNAKDVSHWSHDFVGWQVAQVGEDIPYETVFVSERPLSARERAYALALVAERSAA